MKRNRAVYLLATCLTVILGLASRRYALNLPSWLAEYAGDTLWALMVFFGFGFMLPHWSTMRLGWLALGFAFLVEFSQLSQAGWLLSLRATRFGGLVLGYGFLWSDLICYSVGVLIGIFLERWLLKPTIKITKGRLYERLSGF